MKHNDLMKLQNGSDVRGVAMEGIERESVNLTPDIAARLGEALVSFMSDRLGKSADALKIAVGRDSRLTGEDLLRAFADGVTSAGAALIDCGMASTPGMFMSIIYPETECDASCMITASHLPFNRNGLKFFDRNGGFEKADITALLEMAGEKEAFTGKPDPARVSSYDLISLYAGKLVEIIRDGAGAKDREHPLKGMKIVVDAGNGAGGFFADKVLIPLGADISGSQFLEPDGHFPNHAPNPEDKTAMAAISGAVVKSGADLGLIFDTDVDRMGAVLADGRAVNRDALIAMMAAILADEHPGSTIITDSVTSDRLTRFLEGKLKLKHLCYMRGYKNVINKCKELNGEGIDSPLAMETSGHGCLKENHYLDDGAYLAVKLLTALSKMKSEGRGIESLIGDLSMVFSAAEVRFGIEEEDFKAYGSEVIEEFTRLMSEKGHRLPESHEGVRVSFDKGTLNDSFGGGWLVLRASLHDPVMVLNMEGVSDEDLEAIRSFVRENLSFADRLDRSAL